MPVDTHASMRVKQLNVLMQGLHETALALREQLEDIRKKIAVIEDEGIHQQRMVDEKKTHAKGIGRVVALGSDFVMPAIDLTLAAGVGTDISFQDLKAISPLLDGAIRDLIIHSSHLMAKPIVAKIADHMASRPFTTDHTSIDSLRKAESHLEQSIETLRKNSIKTVFLYQMLIKQVFGERAFDAKRLEDLKESRSLLLQKINTMLAVQQKYTSERLAQGDGRTSLDFSHEIQEAILHMIEDQGMLDVEILFLESILSENKVLRSMQSDALEQQGGVVFEGTETNLFLKSEVEKLKAMDKDLSDAIARLELEKVDNTKAHKKDSTNLLLQKQSQEEAIQHLKIQQRRIKIAITLATTAAAITAGALASPVAAGAVKVGAVGVRQVATIVLNRKMDKLQSKHASDNAKVEENIIALEKEHAFHKDLEQSKNRIASMLSMQRFILEKEMANDSRDFFKKQKADNQFALKTLEDLRTEHQALKKNIEEKLFELQNKSDSEDFSVFNYQQLMIDSAKYTLKNIVLSSAFRATGIDFSEIDEWRHYIPTKKKGGDDIEPLSIEEQQESISHLVSHIEAQLRLIEEKMEVIQLKETLNEVWGSSNPVENKENKAVHALLTSVFLEDSLQDLDSVAKAKIRQALNTILLDPHHAAKIVEGSSKMKAKMQSEITQLLQSLLQQVEKSSDPLGGGLEGFPSEKQLESLKTSVAVFLEHFERRTEATQPWPGFVRHHHHHHKHHKGHSSEGEPLQGPPSRPSSNV